MKTEPNLSNETLSLKYWQAVITFGQEALEAVIGAPGFSRKHPELAEKLETLNLAQLKRIILPEEIIYEIAGRPESLYDFHADAGGNLLYPSGRGKELVRPAGVSDAKKLPTQKALLEYGAYCLFKAVDVGTGYKGEQDIRRERSR